MKRRFAVAQIAARMHYAVPTLLQRAGMLDRLYTDLCAQSDWVRAIQRIVPDEMAPAPLRRLMGRKVVGVPQRKIVSFDAFGLKRFVGGIRSNSPARTLQLIAENNKRFCELVIRRGLSDANAFYLFNAAALEIMQYAKQRSAWMALEQIAAPFKHDEDILTEERQRWPGWENVGATHDAWRPLSEREHAEWELADVILCASQYVADCIKKESGPVHKCAIVPYGVDCSRFTVNRDKKPKELRALCVGQVQLRKGVQYLMQAARLLKRENIRIRLVGRIQVSDEAIGQMREVMDIAGQVPRAQMPEEFAAADVFVLPTLSEGSATVCYEALAAGLPVITTPHAGSVVRDGIEGFIIPIRDPRALADRILELESNRTLLDEMSHRAVDAAQEYDWARYGQRLLKVLSK